ncbi:aminotransferase class I/II-fold pyridoxal phosphate-dependent enzyme [Fulvimarina sp. 2208YS6-2-32]|uniref:aspartate transaminase n=1 Tax=Fulvimarina uroteuthidis TaxID=3098149 RepID=A0ABU5I6L1_9HYPH|nr:aminotransferase class I/II-fold pyridoxal phosphate-dependent enzyme [Fulvimarina sp. 2208YS6-2-32]MDY8111028.1 aminotransferase class I/II-fold pyridoxal phosphate-dependent enzyme [Fulvimarina sp. 2208YS6-2-32]
MTVRRTFKRSQRIASLEISEIVQITERAASLRAEGNDNVTGAMEAGGYGTCADFCTALLERQGLALVPGRAFGLPGLLRLSFAYSQANLEAGLDRLERFLSPLPAPAGEESPATESVS